MKLRNIAIGAAMALATATSANAAVLLTFEGVGDGASIGSYYDGGTDSDGNIGPDYGITFSNIGFATVANDGVANNPSGDTVMYFVGEGRSILNYTAGFTNAFSFFYSSAAASVVRIFEGENGTGAVLASFNLSDQSECDDSSEEATFCNWDTVRIAFAGTARSIDFGGHDALTAFDDIAFESALEPGSPIPEPATWAMMITGFGLAGTALRRRRVSALTA